MVDFNAVIKWAGSSVSGLVVIAGLIIYLAGSKFFGGLLIILGLVGALLMTLIINLARHWD